jgi:putative transposase
VGSVLDKPPNKAQGDFDLAQRGLLGEEAFVSAGTVARLKEQWQAEWEEWRKH